MRIALPLILALLSRPAHAISITKWQENQALTALTAYCATAWCEGDFDYRFRSLRCGKTEACDLGYELRKHNNGTKRSASCHYSPVPAFSSILADEGGPESLNDRFLEALDDCFEKAETARP